LSKIYIKTLKMPLHVSILRSSSGSTYCSLLKLRDKIVNTSLTLLVMWQHIMCMCKLCFQCREVCRLPPCTENNAYTYTWYAATSLIKLTTYSQF